MVYRQSDLLNIIIQHNPQIKSYLEIGTQTGNTYNKINLTDKTGVDIVDKKKSLTSPHTI